MVTRREQLGSADHQLRDKPKGEGKRKRMKTSKKGEGDEEEDMGDAANTDDKTSIEDPPKTAPKRSRKTKAADGSETDTSKVKPAAAAKPKAKAKAKSSAAKKPAAAKATIAKSAPKKKSEKPEKTEEKDKVVEEKIPEDKGVPELPPRTSPRRLLVAAGSHWRMDFPCAK